VRELATRFATPAGAVHVEAQELSILRAAVDLAAYRILAESLAKHGRAHRATSVHLTLLRTTSALEVRVSDDGIGIAGDAAAGAARRGRALRPGGLQSAQVPEVSRYGIFPISGQFLRHRPAKPASVTSFSSRLTDRQLTGEDGRFDVGPLARTAAPDWSGRRPP
jgi:hypothetical protein